MRLHRFTHVFTNAKLEATFQQQQNIIQEAFFYPTQVINKIVYILILALTYVQTNEYRLLYAQVPILIVYFIVSYLAKRARFRRLDILSIMLSVVYV